MRYVFVNRRALHTHRKKGGISHHHQQCRLYRIITLLRYCRAVCLRWPSCDICNKALASNHSLHTPHSDIYETIFCCFVWRWLLLLPLCVDCSRCRLPFVALNPHRCGTGKWVLLLCCCRYWPPTLFIDTDVLTKKLSHGCTHNVCCVMCVDVEQIHCNRVGKRLSNDFTARPINNNK